MSIYASERLQLNQFLHVLNTIDDCVLFSSYSIKDNYFLLIAKSETNCIFYNLVSQKNELRRFKSVQAIYKTISPLNISTLKINFI